MSYPMRRAIAVGCALTLLLLLSVAMAAQSGRRVPKTKAAPVPIPQPTETPLPKPTPTPAPVLTFVVGIERYRGYSFYDVLDNCADRLDDNRSIRVIPVRDDMTWGEAVRRARKESGAHVVRLAISTDAMSGVIDDANYAVEYWVFAPTTAKVATSGRVYAAAYRNSRVILNPRPRTSGIYGDYRLQEAAREAAKRILSALYHPIPPRTLPNP